MEAKPLQGQRRAAVPRAPHHRPGRCGTGGGRSGAGRDRSGPTEGAVAFPARGWHGVSAGRGLLGCSCFSGSLTLLRCFSGGVPGAAVLRYVPITVQVRRTQRCRRSRWSALTPPRGESGSPGEGWGGGPGWLPLTPARCRSPPPSPRRVSSVLNRDVKQFGKKHMFDANEETCWNSDQVGARGRGRMEGGGGGPEERTALCPPHNPSSVPSLPPGLVPVGHPGFPPHRQGLPAPHPVPGGVLQPAVHAGR